MQHDRILILDFGSQVTQLIARRVREAHVYCEVHANDVSAEFIKEFNPAGIILSGSHMSAYEESNDQASQAVFEAGVPVLGICYGMQTMAQQLGGKVESGTKREFGYAEVRAHNHTKLLEGIEDFKGEDGEGMLKVWMSHGDKVSELPPGFVVMASTPSCPIAGMADEKRRFYAVQFHPEVTHTVKGREILQRFVLDICGCRPDWVMEDYITEAVEMIRNQVGKDQVDAVDRFMDALAGETDPEKKRKIIGREFVNCFQAEAEKMTDAKWLAQGTIYPDVIESAAAKTKKAKTIKSHHNVGGLPDTLKLKLLEPLRSLFKDEVRELGVKLGLPAEMVYRHPFPGPGLGVRILGEVKREYADILREADAIFIEELRAAGWYDKVSQAFVVFLPVKSVGVMGDGRTYEWVVSLRSVQTSDFMTAKWSELPYDLLGRVSNRIINEVKGINRVVYDVSGKPPATIEWE